MEADIHANHIMNQKSGQNFSKMRELPYVQQINAGR
jgi:hypothetical protein